MKRDIIIPAFEWTTYKEKGWEIVGNTHDYTFFLIRKENTMENLRLTREEWKKYDEIEKKIRELEYVLNSPSLYRRIFLETRQSDPAGSVDRTVIELEGVGEEVIIRTAIMRLKEKLASLVEASNAR